MAQKNRKCSHCPAKIYKDSISGLCRDCFDKQRTAATPNAQLAADRQLAGLREKVDTLTKKLKVSEGDVKKLQRELHLTQEVSGLELNPIHIEPKQPSGTAEGTVVVLASDWHVEERVNPATVGYQNDYNLDIARARAEKFFRSTLRLTKLLQQDIKIEEMVLALLGDFITNQIHGAENAESNQLTPNMALEFAQNLIVGGIEYLLEHSTLQLKIPCHSGNHARTTLKTRFSAENGHSLEYLMYRHIATHFQNNPRVRMQIADGYHSYVDVYGKTIRFHHGHAVNYQGGVGGLFIPAFKAISQWDKMRQADLDCFGHFHQHKDGGKFVSNGSLIGFNGYALSIKADFEQPKQTLMLFDKDRGRTCTWPILFTK